MELISLKNQNLFNPNMKHTFCPMKKKTLMLGKEVDIEFFDVLLEE